MPTKAIVTTHNCHSVFLPVGAAVEGWWGRVGRWVKKVHPCVKEKALKTGKKLCSKGSHTSWRFPGLGRQLEEHRTLKVCRGHPSQLCGGTKLPPMTHLHLSRKPSAFFAPSFNGGKKKKITKGGKTGITNGGKIESVCERESRGRCSVMQLKRVCPGERYCRKNSAVEGTTVCLLKAVA